MIVSSSLLWHALFKAGLPADEYGRDGPLDGKYWLVDEFDVFSEWTDPHPAEREYDGQHCAGDRTCFRCDPGRTGRRRSTFRRSVRSDWCFVVWEDSE